jgi:PAS domain S-box-containing protein
VFSRWLGWQEVALPMAKILIVEDELVAALSIQEFLERSKHTVVASVTSGAEAIRLAEVEQPDIVLMDIYLEDEIDGITAASQIRERFNIPVIYLTANTEDHTLQRAIATEPFGYLIKPFNSIELYTTIHIALRRYQLEQQFVATEQWLTATLTSIGDGTIVTDCEGLITFINPVAETLTGWERSEALGEPANQVLDLLDAETHGTIENPLLAAMESGTEIKLPDQCVLRTKQGGERAIGDTAAPIRNDRGEITGGVLVFQDITERKQAEELLHRREQEFRALVENSPDAIARFDRDLRYVYVNPAIEQLLNISRQEFINKRNAEMGLPATLVELWDDALHRAFTTKQPQKLEFEYANAEGVQYYQAQIVPEEMQDGTVESLLMVAHGITEYKQAEDNLRQQAERERLLSAIAQRMRQSLDLQEILNTTVVELRQLLQIDRVVIYRFEPDWSGYVIVESVAAGWTSMLGRKLYDPCLATEQCITPYAQGRISSIADIHTAGLADCYVELLDQFQVQANLVIPILQSSSLWGLLVAQHCSAPRPWLPWEIDVLREFSAQLSVSLQQSQLYQQTQQQAQRERALNHVIQAIRNSLNLNTIFDTTVAELGGLLQVDQANILQYLPNQSVWMIVASYSQNLETTPSYVGLEVPDEGPIANSLKRLEIIRLDDANTLEDELSQILAQTFPGAWLTVPLQIGNSIWGSINLVRHTQPFHWQDWQVEITRAIADQLAIAIQQSQLYQQVQQLNADLESQVQERTARLRRAFTFEATLKRITDRVRDSLDEAQILQTAVQELALAIGVTTCNAALYDLERWTSTIAYEFTMGSAIPFQNYTIPMSRFPMGYQQLLTGKFFQFCPLPSDPNQERQARLSCPMFDDQGVLGDLWLINDADYNFTEEDIRLVQLVANQCAIAIRQSRLYQTAQTQVIELERLNRLKDDFLSTISHELRTPMSNIKMAIQMLEIVLRPLGILDESSASSRYFRILRNECDREINLVEDLLELSRLDTGTEPLILSVIEPRSWLTHAIEPLVEQIHSQRQRLEIDIPVDLPTTLTTDVTCLERILSELIDNASKYSPTGATITVFARAIKTGLQIGVRNSGVEIPAQELPRIFDKFYRVPSQDPWRHSGTGLGLALVQELANHIGAIVTVESADNQTTFTLTFPLE